MARYIDADDAIRLSKEDKLAWVYDLTDLEEFLAGVPTADVVPKSEAEKWYNALMGECVMSCCPLHNELRAEVAREIFEKIEKIMYRMSTPIGEHTVLFGDRYAELKKKYTEANHD